MKKKLRNWILGLPFVKSELVNSFALAQTDILAMMQDDIERQAEELSKKKLAELLSPIDPSGIVKYSDQLKAIFIDGKRADDGKLANLKAEAQFFKESELWKLLHETPKELAQQAMFVSGDNAEAQLKAGRSMLFTLSTQQKILDIFLSYEPKK